MAEINYKDLKSHLKKLQNAAGRAEPAPVYLIYGEDLLCQKALEALLNVLLPGADRGLHYEPIDGAQENPAQTIEKINTFSLLAGRKVVAVLGSRIFYSRDDRAALVERAKAAFEAEDLAAAAVCILDLLGLSRIRYEDISPEHPARSLKLETEEPDDGGGWLAQTIEYCRAQGLKIPDRRDRADLLQQALEKGFPPANCLIIVADQADKRRALYRAIEKAGVVIDCAVPAGDRRADKIAQDAVLRGQMAATLKKSGKRMAPDAYPALLEMTGFDLRSFVSSLDKLVSYTGSAAEITAADVEAVLKRTKKDPVYELTNAVADRQLEPTLFFMRSLLDEGLHPLQVLAAMVNQVRRLLILKDFVGSAGGRGWQAGLSFERFKSQVLPAVQAFDQALLNLVDGWQLFRASEDKPGKKKGRKKPSSELLIARNPANAYPVFVLLQKSGNFTKAELIAAMQTLSETDLLLKTSPLKPRLILENAVLSICGRT